MIPPARNLSWPQSERALVVDAASAQKSDPGPGTSTQAAPWNLRRVMTGTRLLVGSTLAALLFLFARGDFGDQLRLLLSLSPLYLGIGLAQALLDFLGGGFRLWFLSFAFGRRIRFTTCVRANGTNVFVGGVTPSQTGGGPAQIYLMAGEGVSYPVAMATSLVAYLGTIVILVGGGAVMMLVAPLHTVGQEFRLFSSIAIGTLLLLLLAFLPAIVKPDATAKALRRVIHRLPIVGRKLADNGPLARLENTARDFSKLMYQAWRHHKLRILGGVVITVFVYLNKFLVAYVVMRGNHAIHSPRQPRWRVCLAVAGVQPVHPDAARRPVSVERLGLGRARLGETSTAAGLISRFGNAFEHPGVLKQIPRDPVSPCTLSMVSWYDARARVPSFFATCFAFCICTRLYTPTAGRRALAPPGRLRDGPRSVDS
jgi:uncharacterized protein (TIRG00374 family)